MVRHALARWQSEVRVRLHALKEALSGCGAYDVLFGVGFLVNQFFHASDVHEMCSNSAHAMLQRLVIYNLVHAHF